MKNSDVQGALEALRELGKLRIPMRTALRVAALQRELKARLEDVEYVRRSLIAKHGAENGQGTVEVRPGDAGWQAFVDGFQELMAEEFTPSERITLYVRGEEVAFTPEFGHALEGIQPNVLADLQGVLEIEEVG